MKKKMNKVVIIAALAVLFGYAFYAFPQKEKEENKLVLFSSATAYYDTSCGCCAQHLVYLKNAGVDLKTETKIPIGEVKRKHNIPYELMSCHTTIINGYIIEGHMPVEAINKLLEEKPEIRGIALAGMPSGSPGMPGIKTETWTIYAFQEDGSSSIFMEM